MAARAAFETRASAVEAVGDPEAVAAAAAIRNAFEMEFDSACEREKELFHDLRRGRQAQARIHAFIAERDSAHVEGVTRETARRPIRNISIVGSGTMGGGIGISMANAGYTVTMIDMTEEAVAAAKDRLWGVYAGQIGRGRITQEAAEASFANFRWCVGTRDGVAEADLVVEAVFEDMELKKRLFADLDKWAPAHAILASNTSYQNIDEMAAQTSRPDRVIGMHYFSPANVMRLVEVVRGAETSPETIATVLSVCRRTEKVPVVVRVCYGFVGNRMLWLRTLECQSMLLEGNSPSDIDRALTDFGFRMGPFAMADLAGLDVAWRLRQARGERLDPVDAIVEAERLGQKNGKGYYLYPEGQRTGVPDPEVARIIKDTADRLGCAPRHLDQEELLARMLYPMINEAARILEEGIVERASDIDVIYIYGYNWPRNWGGPMWYADHVGVGRIVAALDRFFEETGRDHFRPAPLLRRLADEGRPILESLG